MVTGGEVLRYRLGDVAVADVPPMFDETVSKTAFRLPNNSIGVTLATRTVHHVCADTGERLPDVVCVTMGSCDTVSGGNMLTGVTHATSTWCSANIRVDVGL